MYKSLITKTTNITVAIGLFLSGGLLFGLMGLQGFIWSLGFDCAEAWKILWVITGVGCFVLPIMTRGYIKRNYMKIGDYGCRLRFKYRIITFCLLEMACFQLGLGLFFTTPEILCYAHDAQVGFELIFAGMAAVPIIIMMGYVFQRFLNNLIDRNIDI